MPDVIVFLPGITGSVLTRGSDIVWGFDSGAIGRALLSLGGSLRRDLTLRDDSRDPDVAADGIEAVQVVPDIHLLPGVWKIDGYSKALAEVQRAFEVTAGVNYFEFAYDWRRDNRVNANRLARQAHGWLTRYRASTSPDARLILVAHSMGGLISRYFIEVLDGWKDTRALITFGTPYRGSLNAIDALANGMRKGPRGLIDLSEMGRSFTSMYQLLPIYECYDAGNGALTRVGETAGIPNIDAARAADALAFHNEIRSAVDVHLNQAAYLADRYRIHPFVGINQQTSQSAIRREDGTGVDLVPSLSGRDLAGDGTVPRVSATPIEYSRAGLEKYAATQHGSLQNDDSVLINLAGVITGLSFDLGDFRGQTEKTIGLEVEDLHFDDEPVVVRALVRDADGDRMSAAIAAMSGEDLPEQARRIALRAMGDGWYQGEVPPLPEGGYRVRVSLPGAHPAEDTFVVATRDAR